TGEGWQEILTPPKLMNALGRAGRAGRETEGWAFITSRGQLEESSSFAPFDQEVDGGNWSRLNQPDVLAPLWRFETQLRQDIDEVFVGSGDVVDDFVGHVWLTAALLEALGRPLSVEAVLDGASDTLGLQALPRAVHEKWMQVARHAFTAYER